METNKLFTSWLTSGLYLFLDSLSVSKVVRSSDTVIEGDAYNLSCEATGDPMPNVTWITVRNNQRSDGNLLNFTNIDRSDAGDYKCEANNRCGVKTKTAAISVFCEY